MYLISAKASEILKWSDTPRKRADVRVGYQREVELKRVNRIARFLELDSKNFLPSAILVALRPETTSIKSQDGFATISIDVPASSPESRRHELQNEILKRLVTPISDLPEQPQDAIDESDDPEADFLPPPSYFESLARELVQYDQLPLDRQKSIDEFAESYAKPGLILDGQHRVFGAKEFEDAHDEIFLPIVLLPDLAPEEQVFHFYILNNTAKPLNKSQLRSIVSTSLARAEIDDLYLRFEQAGVDPEQAQWTFLVNNTEESPFMGLINFGLSGESGPLKDGVMDQVISSFVKLPKKYNSLVEKVPEWTNNPDSRDFKLTLFYALWDSVRSNYPSAWRKGQSGDGQLFYKVGLLGLQDFILEQLKSALPWMTESPFSSPEVLRDAVTTSLQRLPEKFFLQDWVVKSLDTRDGMDFFIKQINEVVEADGRNLGNRKLFKAMG
jgi:DGQHR domain-containing protein